MHPYATSKELKQEAFTVNSQGNNQKVAIWVTFTLQIKLEKSIFIQNTTTSLANYASIFNRY